MVLSITFFILTLTDGKANYSQVCHLKVLLIKGVKRNKNFPFKKTGASVEILKNCEIFPSILPFFLCPYLFWPLNFLFYPVIFQQGGILRGYIPSCQYTRILTAWKDCWLQLQIRCICQFQLIHWQPLPSVGHPAWQTGNRGSYKCFLTGYTIFSPNALTVSNSSSTSSWILILGISKFYPSQTVL